MGEWCSAVCVFFFSLFSWLQMKLSVQESTMTRLQNTLRDREEEVHSLKETVAEQKEELHAGEMERRRLHNTIQELKASQHSPVVVSSSTLPLFAHKLKTLP